MCTICATGGQYHRAEVITKNMHHSTHSLDRYVTITKFILKKGRNHSDSFETRFHLMYCIFDPGKIGFRKACFVVSLSDLDLRYFVIIRGNSRSCKKRKRLIEYSQSCENLELKSFQNLRIYDSGDSAATIFLIFF